MPFIPKEEINPLMNLLDSYGTRSSIVPENQLFEIKERPPVRNMLPKLNRSNPLIRVSLKPRARLAEMVSNGILNEIRLLKTSSVKNLGLNSELEFDSLGVRLSPDELSVREPDFVEILEPLDAESQELFGFPLSFDPRLGWLQVAATLRTIEDLDTLL